MKGQTGKRSVPWESDSSRGTPQDAGLYIALSERRKASAARLPQLDWLRGIAALGVFIFHLAALSDFPKRTLPPVAIAGYRVTELPSPFALGASGVNLFFVLSGFCLALQQWRAAPAPWRGARLLRYARHRLARIVPAYWAACIFSALVAHALGEALTDLVPTTTSHLLFAHGFIRTHFLTLNGALWSMATEVEFYVVFPALLAFYPRGRAATYLVVVGVLTLSLRAGAVLASDTSVVGGISTSAFFMYQLPGRLLDFCVGIALADVYLAASPLTWGKYSLLATLPLGLWARAVGPAAVADPALALMYGSIVATLLPERVSESRLALLRWLNGRGAAFGRASYSFFLVHAPIQQVVKAVLPLPQFGPWVRLVVYGVSSLTLSFLGGAVLYRWVELPLWKRLRDRSSGGV